MNVSTYLNSVCAGKYRFAIAAIARVIDQTSSGFNNRQSVCREKKDFPVSDCMFQELFMSL